MPSTYSSNLRTLLMQTGENAGSWGDNTNFNLGTLMEQAISSYVKQTMATGTTVTLTIGNASDAGNPPNTNPTVIYGQSSAGTATYPVSARNMYIELIGTGGTNTFLEVPANRKLYFVYNNTAGAITVRVTGQTGVSVPAGKKFLLVCNGTDIVLATSAAYAVSVASSNGFAGTSDGAANPTLTLTTTASGILKGSSGALVASTVFVESGSNAGIGTTPSTYKLEVSGDIRTLSGGDLRLGSAAGTTTAAGDSLIVNDNNNMLFSTGTTTATRMTLDSSGNLGLGVTPDTNLHVYSATAQAIKFTQATGATKVLLGNQDSAGANKPSIVQAANAILSFGYGNSWATSGGTFTETMRLSAAGGLSVGTTADPGAGAVYATGNITAYYSDDRLKTRKGNIENALSKVLSLDGFHYEANETAQALGYKAKPEVGLSAQQVQAVLPEVVVPAPIDEQYLTVHYERLIPLLVEAIKEQNKKIEALEARLNGMR